MENAVNRQQGTGADLIFVFESLKNSKNENEDERASSLFKNTLSVNTIPPPLGSRITDLEQYTSLSAPRWFPKLA